MKNVTIGPKMKAGPNKGLLSGWYRGTVRNSANEAVRVKSKTFYGAKKSSIEQQITAWIHSGGLAGLAETVNPVAAIEVITNGQYLQEWFDQKLGTWSVTTQQTNTANFYRHVKANTDFCAVPLSDLELPHLLAYINSIDGTSSTKNNVLKLIKPAYRLAVRLKYLKANPFMDLEKSEVPKASRSKAEEFRPADEAKLLAFIHAHDDVFWRAAVLVGLDAGVGPAELFGLRADDINWSTAHIHIRRNVVSVRNQPPQIGPTKADSRVRYIHVCENTLDALRALVTAQTASNGHVFTDAGQLWRADNFRSKWTRLLKHAGIKHYSFYTCRHTMACATLRSGMPLQAVSKRLGHAKIATTLQHYVHALPNEADQGSEFFARRLAGYLSPPKFATVHQIGNEIGNGDEKVAV